MGILKNVAGCRQGVKGNEAGNVACCQVFSSWQMENLGAELGRFLEKEYEGTKDQIKEIQKWEHHQQRLFVAALEILYGCPKGPGPVPKMPDVIFEPDDDDWVKQEKREIVVTAGEKFINVKIKGPVDL